jgi:2-dehydropantoate 2-reductase
MAQRGVGMSSDGRITIWGAGAMGGTVGAWLAKAGHDVLLVDSDRAHVEAVRANGLRIVGMRGEHRFGLSIVTPEEVEGSLRSVLLAVKCHHTRTALARIGPLLAADGYVLSLQNGLNEELIAREVGAARTVGCFVNFSADVLRPGVIEFGGEHPIYIGELDGQNGLRTRQIAATLRAFGETVTTPNIWGYLWSKLCFISLLFATTLVDAPIYEVVRHKDAQEVIYQLVGEAASVPLGLGVQLEELHGFHPLHYLTDSVSATLEKVAQFYEGQTKVKSGSWRDIAVHHRPTQVDCLVGALVAKGDGLGLPLPLNRSLVAMVHELETGARRMQWANFQDLAIYAGTL